MTLTRRPTRLLMPEIPLPASVPANMALLFTRDLAGVTKVSYQLSTGGVVDLGPVGGGGGGGGTPSAEYINIVRDYGADATGSADSAGAFSAAFTYAGNHTTKVVYVPGGSYRSNSQISVPAGIKLMGPRIVGEGSYATIFAGAAGLTNLVSVAGSGMVQGLTIDGGTNAARALYCASHATSLSHVVARGGTQHSLLGEPGTNRHRWDHITCLGDGHPSIAVFEIYSTDHLVDSIWAEGPGNNAHGFVVNGNTGMFSNIHAWGGTGTGAAVYIDPGGDNGGSQNSLTNIYAYGCGSSAEAPIVSRGSRNMFGNAHVFGAAGKPAAAIRGNKGGNMFFGLSYDDDAVPSSRIIAFLDSAGALSNSPSNFPGTRVYWSSVNTLQVSGAYHNLSNPQTGDGIDIVGYSAGGTVGSTNVRT